MVFQLRRLLRVIGMTAGIALGAIVVAVSAFVGFYDLHNFRPYSAKIDTIYQALEPEDRQPPSNVEHFVWKVEGNKVDNLATQGLLSDTHGPMRMSAWHYHFLMWELMLRLHFDNAKRLAFYCHYLPHEQGRGFSNGANLYFGKLPHELTNEQLATLVAIGRSPSMNSPTRHPESLERNKIRLLDTYSAAR